MYCYFSLEKMKSPGDIENIVTKHVDRINDIILRAETTLPILTKVHKTFREIEKYKSKGLIFSMHADM